MWNYLRKLHVSYAKKILPQKFINVFGGGRVTVMKFNTLFDDQSLKFPLNIITFLFIIILFETNHFLKFNFNIKCLKYIQLIQ